MLGESYGEQHTPYAYHLAYTREPTYDWVRKREMKLFPPIHLAVKYSLNVACVDVNCKHKAFSDNFRNSDAEFDESLNHRISESSQKILSPVT